MSPSLLLVVTGLIVICLGLMLSRIGSGSKFLCWGGSSIEQPFQLLVVDFSWIIGYFTRSAFTIRAIGGSEFYRIFLSDHPLIYSEHQVSVERKSDLVRTSTIGYPGPVVRVSLHDS